MQACIALPYACRNLNDEEAAQYCQQISMAIDAIQLAELDDDILQQWWQCLRTMENDPQITPRVAGLSARLLYQAEQIDVSKLQLWLERALSPAVPAMDAAQFFEGFFTEAIDRLLYDPVLLTAVERWLLSLIHI